MPVGKEELARRLKAAREACNLRQDDVARHLGVSRSTIAQIELANRAVSSLELDKLAYLLGRDIRELLADEFNEEDVLVALFRKHPEIAGQEQLFRALRDCIALGREITDLECALRIDRDLAALPSYTLPPPRTKWDAIQQGERVAVEERRRLGLGISPLPNVAELLESQGARTAQVRLPNDVSGLTLVEPELGVLVVANVDHAFPRRRFSYTHEYCHVLLDRGQRGTISRTDDRDSVLEVRANTFAAGLLMPRDGVVEFVRGLAKGRPSRLQAEIFDEEEASIAQARPAPGSQTIQLYDVVLLAHHFGVSRLSALYRLKNLKLVSDPRFDELKSQDEQGLGKALLRLLDLPDPDDQDARNEFRHRFLALALEAFRREEVSRQKLFELARMVGVADADLDKLLVRARLDESTEAADVLAPEE
ncbi:MAG: helix-turn-helix domain-containing protein [Planctomycetota bacterium]